MQVTLPSHSPVLDRRLIRRLLVKCRQQAIRDGQVQMASLSFPLPSVDPLSVLAQLHNPHQQHFYWQHQAREIAAGGTALAIPTAPVSADLDPTESTPDRFCKTEQFVRFVLERCWSEGEIQLSGAGPLFCCGFSFFGREAANRKVANERQNRPASKPRNPETTVPETTVFVPRWTVIRHQQGCVATLCTAIDAQTNIGAERARIEALEDQLRNASIVAWPEAMPAFRRWETGEGRSADEFRSGVSAALQAIAAGELNKVVLAHAAELRAPQTIKPFLSLHNLRQLYPKCYIFSLGNGHGQQFMGASPEALMHVHQGRLAIDAIAGSAARGTSELEDQRFAQSLMDSSKDRLEHRVVVDSIVQQLHSLGISAAAAASPNLLRLPNIQHLYTRICAQLPEAIHPLRVLSALHPTPAVAGEPRSLACDRIREWESFERGLYAAPVGWLDGRGDCELAVGIRSALVEGERVRLCAGAGIVAGSDPEKEWAEVQLKLQALMQALV
ncbi:MAG: isochorismate synthase [Cyanobacteria bacterium P01_A01_bin.3]